jgi:hypothetical protein
VARFHIMHVIPDPRLHGLHGYREVIETLAWGLSQLGHEVGYALNQFDPAATNIVFGAHMLPLENVEALPAGTISYNLEQVRNLDARRFSPAQRRVLERCEIWEYSPANLPTWQAVRSSGVKLVPLGYAPVLSRIAKPAVQDIDVLIYGMSGPRRLAAFHRLSLAGLVVAFVSGLYGAARDELIGRAKLVLNAHIYELSQIFELVRVSYLLANRKAVLAIKDAQTYVEEDIAAAVRFTSLEQLVDDSRRLLDDGAQRVALEGQGFEVFARRDIRDILQRAL